MLTKEEFWSIVNKAVELSNGDKDLQAQLMAEQLLEYEDISIASFRCISDKFIDEIDTKTLLAAENLIRGGHPEDDPHYYFLNWVVSLGENAYNKILANPDSIIDYLPAVIIPPFGSEVNYEDMYLVFFTAIELKYKDIKTDDEICEICEKAGDEAWSIHDFVWQGVKDDGFLNIEIIKQKLPRLCQMYEKREKYDSIEELFKFHFND